MSVQRYIILLFPAIRQNWLLTLYTKLAVNFLFKLYGYKNRDTILRSGVGLLAGGCWA